MNVFRVALFKYCADSVCVAVNTTLKLSFHIDS